MRSHFIDAKNFPSALLFEIIWMFKCGELSTCLNAVFFHSSNLTSVHVFNLVTTYNNSQQLLILLWFSPLSYYKNKNVFIVLWNFLSISFLFFFLFVFVNLFGTIIMYRYRMQESLRHEKKLWNFFYFFFVKFEVCNK